MMQHLNRMFMVKDKYKYVYYLRKLHKLWKASPDAIYFSYGEKKAPCVVEALNEYINRSKPWRDSNHKKELISSLIRPHNAVVYKIITSGWLKKTINRAGVNTDLFRAYSTRFASSSKGSMGGVGGCFSRNFKQGIMVSSIYLAKIL